MTDSASAWIERNRLLILAAITLLGAFLRLYRLDQLPPAASFDAAQYGLDALQILDGARPVFLAANFGREALFSYLVAFVYWLNVPRAYGIHLAAALIGTATIPAVYAAGRALTARSTARVSVGVGLLAALVTAVSYWHINYSRAGLRVILVPLFAAAVTALLWRGLQHDSRLSLAAAGLLLGLSQYTYQAARLLPLLLGAGFALFYWRERSFTRRDAANVLLTFGLALLVFVPLGRFALDQPHIFNDRLRQTALLSQDADLREQFKAVTGQASAALRMFFIEGDHEPQYTIPGRPSLNPFLAAAFLAGIGVALWRWRDPTSLYLLLWLALLTAPAMIADQAATAKRALGAFPAVAILAGLGLALPLEFAWRRGGSQRSPALALLTVLLGGGLLWSAWRSYDDYFQRWGQDPALAGHFERDHTEVGLAAARVPDDLVVISPFAADHPAIVLNSGNRDDLRSYNGHRCLLIPNAGERGLSYVIVPGETETSLAQLGAVFPDGAQSPGPPRPDRAGVYLDQFTVSAGQRPQLAPARGPALIWDEQIALRNVEAAETARAGEDFAVTLTYEALQDLDRNFTAYVHLLNADGELIAQVDAEPCGGAVPTSAWRAGDLLRDRLVLRLPEELAPGDYQISTGFYSWPDITPLTLSAGESGEIGRLRIR